MNDEAPSNPRNSWPLALQSVFGVEFESPDHFVEWAGRQSLEWIAPERAEARMHAEVYLAAKHRIDTGAGTWMDKEVVEGMDEWMNGPHPLLDAIHRSLNSPSKDDEAHG